MRLAVIVVVMLASACATTGRTLKSSAPTSSGSANQCVPDQGETPWWLGMDATRAKTLLGLSPPLDGDDKIALCKSAIDEARDSLGRQLRQEYCSRERTIIQLDDEDKRSVEEFCKEYDLKALTGRKHAQHVEKCGDQYRCTAISWVGDLESTRVALTATAKNSEDGGLCPGASGLVVLRPVTKTACAKQRSGEVCVVEAPMADEVQRAVTAIASKRCGGSVEARSNRTIADGLPLYAESFQTVVSSHFMNLPREKLRALLSVVEHIEETDHGRFADVRIYRLDGLMVRDVGRHRIPLGTGELVAGQEHSFVINPLMLGVAVARDGRAIDSDGIPPPDGVFTFVFINFGARGLAFAVGTPFAGVASEGRSVPVDIAQWNEVSTAVADRADPNDPTGQAVRRAYVQTTYTYAREPAEPYYVLILRRGRFGLDKLKTPHTCRADQMRDWSSLGRRSFNLNARPVDGAGKAVRETIAEQLSYGEAKVSSDGYERAMFRIVPTLPDDGSVICLKIPPAAGPARASVDGSRSRP